MSEELLTDRPVSDVLRLRLNRPDRLNAINMTLVRALNAALDRVDARAVVLGSSTPQAFCSGADLDLDDAERAEVSDLLYELYEKMVRLPVPIVVAIDGHAVGAGIQLAVAGDLRVAGPQAKMRVAGPGHGSELARLDPGAVGRVKRVVTEASGHLDALREERSGNRAAWSGSVGALSLRRGGRSG
ncbi:MAG: enoyl-CoA hydratase/isomerase family protein [Actinobacteria bacterium]|nr:enoyl-CoA hydratase/isomerase family protein [Actinomycetota bacterium]